MKKLILIVAMMVSVSSVANNNQKENHNEKDDILVIEGKFAAEKNVTYTIFQIQDDGNLEQLSSEKGTRYFSCKLEVGNKYIIQFTSKENVTKELTVDVTDSGFFQVIVDFKRSDSAKLEYNDKKSEYEVKSLPGKHQELVTLK